jgi:hypothetical protein
MLHRPHQVTGEVRDHVHRLGKCLGAPQNLKNRVVVRCAVSIGQARVRLGTPRFGVSEVSLQRSYLRER